jgi:biotin transport system substrate-specific component
MRLEIKSFERLVKGTWTKDAVVGISSSLLLALAAPLTMHLPFTPVPVTLQVQVALLLSAFLGPVRAVWMVSAFLLQGAIGWPVFAGGASSIANLIGPRGGYLLGYLAAAFIVGRIYQARKKTTIALFLSMLIGNLIVYVVGFSWLSAFVGLQKAFFLGIAPFVLADLVKLTMITLLKKPVEYLYRSYLKK